jgi:hypothetical protein
VKEITNTLSRRGREEGKEFKEEISFNCFHKLSLLNAENLRKS